MHRRLKFLTYQIDVILTTLKPQLKNVTATDVEASLYYLHLNTEEDAKLLAEAEASILEEEKVSEVVQKPLSRKPLPESSRSSIELHRKPVAAPEPLSNFNSNNKILRKPLAPEQPRAQSDSESQEGTQRRPLGPRPFMSEAVTGRQPVSDIESRPSSSGSQVHRPMKSTSSKETDLKEIFSSTKACPKTFSVTIIRRDPSSAAQWNIGTFVGDEECDQKLRPAQSKKPYYNISVNIITPGYGQFRDHPAGGEAAGRIISPNNRDNMRSGFERSIRMEGSSFWDRSKQHKRAHSDVPDSHNTTHGQRGSTDSLNTPFSNLPPNESQESHTKGYSFGSPWGGRCKFFTSGSGRTLRCNHTLPSPVSASNTIDERASSQVAVIVSELRFNLPSSTIFQSPMSTNNAAKGRGTDLGRFHIPKFDQIRSKLSPDKPRPMLPPRPHSQLRPPPGSYAAMYPSDNEDPPTLPPRPFTNSHIVSSDGDGENYRHSSTIHPLQHRPGWTSEEEEEEHRLDLSLGQEKAGGGTRGKRVKLGKLIVFDEGCKMMDLVVAANMSVWWSIWECNA